jgi:serine/threonine protein kinase/DNA-binding winged helix-turn-helix (wHTH) protein/tetratricopeptide (TPR) repeat protein
MSTAVRFGVFALDRRTGELRKHGRKIRLQEQPLRILALLVDKPGELVMREEIQDKLWPNDTIVDFEYGINSAMMRLRAALGDSAAQPRYIETITRRGYRFLMPVERGYSSTETPSPPQWTMTEVVSGAKLPDDDGRSRTIQWSGQVVSHYLIQECIGSGGMGVVYRAKDTRLGRSLALKFLSYPLTGDREHLERFQREARAASGLNHANICTIYEVDEHQGHPFIAMELLEGETLQQRIAGRTFSLDELLDFAIQVADAFETAHENGIIHRDIKPANMFISKHCGAKILDFGLALHDMPKDTLVVEAKPVSSQNCDDLNASGKVAGTAAYMSPEQIRGEELDARSDLFSFGIVLSEMATGAHPFQGGDAASVREAILSHSPDTVAIVNQQRPAELARIIRKALEKERRLRYQSAGELRADLTLLRRDSGARDIYRPSFSRMSRVDRRFRLRSRWIAALAASVLGVGALAIYFHPSGRSARSALLSATPPIRSIVVMPFQDLSSTKGQEYLVEGTTDAVITDLAKLRTVDVIFLSGNNKKLDKPLAQIARESNADAIVEGTVLRDGKSVRLTAKLIRGDTGRYIWADKYEGDVSEMMTMQSEVSSAIAAQILATLEGGTRAQPIFRQNVDAEAYDDYLKGRYFWNKRTPADLKKSIGYFNSTIERDSAYAPGYAGLADTYLLQGELTGLAPHEIFMKARAATEQALKLDTQLAEAHASLGAIDRNESKWTDSEREFRRALELNPSYATAHQWYAELLVDQGRLDEASAEINRAAQLDPLSLPINTRKGRILLLAGKVDQAIAQLHATVEMDPQFYMSHANLGDAYMLKGMYREAALEWRKSADLNPRPIDMVRKAQLFALSGQTERARQVLPSLEDLSRQGKVPLYELSTVYFLLGDGDRAFSLMEAAATKHEFKGGSLKQLDPLFGRMLEDGRFVARLRRAGFEL